MTLILNSNLKVGSATTQYNGININSMVKAYGKYFAATPNGLYLMGDTSEDVDAYFITATMDFGISNDKRIRYVYLSLESDGNLQLDIHTEKVTTKSYLIEISQSGQQDVRIPISRNLYGRFWTFKVSNIPSSADFSIDEIKVLPIIRGHAH